ncbi:AIPR family protein [Xanthomonas sp. WHRI 10064A]|uniref:AIPR family protein n=1 Tax=unclassified Xanthomonas TaxID=2643310 RepID=UPI002B229B09|nr:MULTISPECIES: AIPR family protein [unclassified Xanthomonas]MEA9589632.1 AIPR family protein [Xanthomonas sp. WHRI 10064B]MEA9617017.1 AIPR family protein [Xanthomonas sp. WHRI 10064A]
MLDLSYPRILQLFGKHMISGRVESRAFLGWFLENYFRLDETSAQDAICDGVDDKGIDGIYVDDNMERIVVFQAKLRQNNAKTLGDNDLKLFAGTLDQLKTAESVAKLSESTGNNELKHLIKNAGLGALVEKGYEVRGVFVTNAVINDDADDYLKHRIDIGVVDENSLKENWVPPGEAAPVGTEVKFNLDGAQPIEYSTGEAKVFVTVLRADELVQMAGLQNGELFSWNVRQTLGKTKVNKAISESARNQAEHKNFVFYHNGLTILAEDASFDRDVFRMSGYTVVNGCQSLTTLYENRESISTELKLITRIVRLSPASELAAKITRHSNNQNSISARDLQSNSNIQRRLQAEFQHQLGNLFGYEIKRGEAISAKNVITNELAARILLAFDLQQPWSCHQSYRLFDDLHSEIFGRPEVNAWRIASISVIFDAVNKAMSGIDNKLVASYTLTTYFLMYLLRQALEVDAEGKQFCRNPEAIAKEIGFDNLFLLAQKITADLVIDLNAEIKDRSNSDHPFDYKRELKSLTAVRALAREIIPSYEKAIKRDRATSFKAELAAARNESM